VDSVLIFVHIPKAGGTALNNIINKNYQKGTIFQFNKENSFESFIKLTGSEKSKYSCFRGHIGYGLHNYLPKDISVKYITMLRDPIDRVVSHYYYVLRQPEHYLHEEVCGRGMSLKEYVLSELTSELCNGQTRLLASFDGEVIDFNKKDIIDGNDLKIAKINLQKYFSFVGITEEFDVSVLLLREIFKWDKIYYYKKNASRSRPTLSSIGDSVKDIISKNNSIDMELYEYAKDLFHEKLKFYRDPIEAGLKPFKLCNRIYSSVYGPLARMNEITRIKSTY